MNQWFFLQHGRPTGPVDTAQIRKEIEAGRLKRGDLIYRSGDTQWRQTEFFDEFKDKKESKDPKDPKTSFPDDPKQSSERPWVVLTKKSSGKGYRQSGPFSTQDIMRQLNEGTLSLSDRIWKEGFSEWLPLHRVEDFQQKDVVTKSFLELSHTEPNILPQNAIKPAPKTDDFELPDLDLNFDFDRKTEIPSKVETSKTKEERTSDMKRVLRRGRKRPKPQPSLVLRVPLIQRFFQMSFPERLFASIVILVALVSLVLLQNYSTSYFDRKKLSFEPPPSVYVEPNVQPVAIEESKKPALSAQTMYTGATSSPVVQNAPEIKKAPTWVQLKIANSGALNAEVIVVTDGSSEHSAQLVLQAQFGDVVDVKGIERRIKLTGQQKIFRPSDKKLPWGTYTVVATMGDLKSEATLDYGTTQPDFQKKLKAYKKYYVFEYNSERLSFIKTVSRIEREIYKFIQAAEQINNAESWKSFHRAWSKSYSKITSAELKRVNAARKFEYTLGHRWLILKEKKKLVDNQISVVNTNKYSSKAFDVKAFKTSAREITLLKDQVIADSLWR